jgi:hypothetical protein
MSAENRTGFSLSLDTTDTLPINYEQMLGFAYRVRTHKHDIMMKKAIVLYVVT